jgi:hypothetical protein
MVYGKSDVFDAERLIDLLNAFESFSAASRCARLPPCKYSQPLARQRQPT